MSEETPVTPPAPKPRGRVGSAVLPVGGVVILALVARWIFGLLPGHGTGNGAPETPAGNGSSQVAPATTNPVATSMPATPDVTASVPPTHAATEPTADASKTMQVTIHEHQFLVDGQAQTVAQIVSAAQAKTGATPAVKIIAGPDLRVGAEKELEAALDAAGARWEVWGEATRP